MKKTKYNEEDVLDQVTVIRIESQADMDRFNQLIREEHYLKNSRIAGKVIRHVGVYKGEWLALMRCIPNAIRPAIWFKSGAQTMCSPSKTISQTC